MQQRTVMRRKLDGDCSYKYMRDTDAEKVRISNGHLLSKWREKRLAKKRKNLLLRQRNNAIV